MGNQKEELKSCPFCGSKARAVTDGLGRWGVQCFKNPIEHQIPCIDFSEYAKENVIRVWNTRPAVVKEAGKRQGDLQSCALCGDMHLCEIPKGKCCGNGNFDEEHECQKQPGKETPSEATVAEVTAYECGFEAGKKAAETPSEKPQDYPWKFYLQGTGRPTISENEIENSIPNIEGVFLSVHSKRIIAKAISERLNENRQQ